MPKTRQTWREKLEKKQERKMVDTSRGMMLVPVPLDVDVLVHQVPEGKLVTVNQIRDRLARDHGADYACPLATGWFVRIVAEKAEENLREGVEDIAPCISPLGSTCYPPAHLRCAASLVPGQTVAGG